MAEAEVTIDAATGTIAIRGDEKFVSETLEKYRFVFERAPMAKEAPASAASAKEPAKTPASAGGTLDAYTNVYDVADGNVSILISPPGNSTTAQAKALILLYLFAQFKLGEQAVSGEAIKEQCKAHACFDQKNFAGHLKGQKNWVTVTGSNASAMARLTVPGRKAAEDLAMKLQGAG